MSGWVNCPVCNREVLKIRWSQHANSKAHERAIEKRGPLWGEDGPERGQVIALPDIPGVQMRWTGTHWEEV